MTTAVVTVTPDTPLGEARQHMDAQRIRALPVLRGNELVGIVTRRGLLRTDLSSLAAARAWEAGSDLAQETIGHIMTHSPVTIAPDAPLPRAARIMLENKFTVLPVVDAAYRLVGILTSSDLFRVILAEVPALGHPILVQDYMTREVVTITPDTSLLEAHRLVGVKRIRALPVLDGSTLVGVITRTDLLTADPSRFTGPGQQDTARHVENQPVAPLMTRDVTVIAPTAAIGEAARLMLEGKFHCLPVVSASGELEGILTESDLFRLIVQKFL